MKHKALLTQTESRRICILLLSLTAVIGIIIGSITAVSATDCKSEWLHQYFSPICSGNTLFEVFRNTFVSSFIFLLAIFILGLSAIGQPVGIGLLIYRGVGIGFSVALMYLQSGIEAVPAVLLLVVPKAAAIIFLSSLAVREMLKLSCSQFNYLFRGSASDNKNNSVFRLYCIKFAIIAVILMIVSVLDSALNYVFMDLI